MNSNFKEIGDVERMLKIAKKHLDYIRKSKTKRIIVPGPKLDHAIITSLCSAIAIETALNIFISTPILYIKDKNLRRFFGSIVTEYARLSVPSKLKFIAEFSPEMKKEKILLKKVEELFKYRNSIAHSSTKYGELINFPVNFPDSKNYDIYDPETEPFLFIMGEGDNEVSLSFQHYKVANEFLERLKFFEPTNPAQNIHEKIQNPFFKVQRKEAE